MFQKILIANRGEIAVRVIRACREMGVESVAVFSDADARSQHAALADHAVRIGPAAASEGYLSIDAIVGAARQLAARAGAPVVPGDTPSDQSDRAIADGARRVGFPVLLKPAEGGGGI